VLEHVAASAEVNLTATWNNSVMQLTICRSLAFRGTFISMQTSNNLCCHYDWCYGIFKATHK